MKTISFRIILAILISSITASMLLCGVSIQRSATLLQGEVEKNLTFASQKYAYEFSSIFKNTEGMVDAVAANVAVTFDPNKYYSDQEYIQEYKSYLNKIIKETITDSEAAQGLYFTFNPKLKMEEVWYAYNNQKKLVYIDADFNLHKRDFTEPVSPEMLYYFQPIWNKAGAWTGPYFDADISLDVLSYSKAVYVNGVLIGVAGADILTEHTIDIVQTMKIYKGGYAFLLDENYNVMIHPKYKEGMNFNAIDHGKLSFITKEMKSKNTGVAHFLDGKRESIMAFTHLSNGWILGINQPTNEVYLSIRIFSTLIVGLTIAVILLTVIFAIIFAKRFSKPILSAADQLKLLEMGDYTQDIPEELLNRKDDLGEFGKAISTIQTAIKQEASENREKDVLLIYQSKQAKIGEMVGNISHQWKQPLNNINLILLNLYDAYQYKELDDELMKETVEKTTRIVKTMSETIEDFTDFLKPNREKNDFDVAECIKLALSLMEASIKYHGIAITVELEDHLTLYGFPNEFSHVLFNVLNNARDATVTSHGLEKMIAIYGYQKEEQVIIEIRNKGNLIPESLLPEVFDPYITTKGEKEGTGIGLYISKLIIEQRMGGKIELFNMEDGVCCRISVERRK